MVLLAPTDEAIKIIHDTFMKQYGCKGYMCEGMVQGCLERAMTYVYKYQPFPKLLMKAGAILYSFITFHPFVDGNKRTAFETTRIFLRLNGYELRVPTQEGVDVTRAIANQEITDVTMIAMWLRKYSRRNIIYVIMSFLTKGVIRGYNNLPKERKARLDAQTEAQFSMIQLFPE
jgi:death-on-curing protein